MREDTFMPPRPMLSPSRPRLGDSLKLAALGALLGGLIALAPLGLTEARAAEATHIAISANTYGATRPVSMSMNKSLIVDLPADTHEVIVSQPGVANAILRTKRRVVLQSVGSGDTNMFFLDAAGRTIVVLDVSVKGAVSNVAAALRETYAKALPGARIDVESVALVDTNGNSVNRIVLSGYAPTADDVEKAVSIAGQFAGSADNVASVISVGGPQQVMLKVTVAEVNRQVAKALGINLGGSYSSGGISTRLVSTQPIGGMSNLFTNNGVTASFNAGGLSIDATIRALQQQRAIRTLAEPTLTAMSGEPADFVAGGQFPVPTDVDERGRITYSYKDFGVKLSFTPTIKSSGNIGLLVDTSVSELSAEGSIIGRRHHPAGHQEPPGQDLGRARRRPDPRHRRPDPGLDPDRDQPPAGPGRHPDPRRAVPLPRLHPRPDRDGRARYPLLRPGEDGTAGAADRPDRPRQRRRGDFPRPHRGDVRRRPGRDARQLRRLGGLPAGLMECLYDEFPQP